VILQKKYSTSFLSNTKLIAVFCLFISVGKAQYSDVGLWIQSGFEKNISQKLAVSASPQIRFNENITELSKYFVDLGVTYKLIKDLKISGNYRFINQQKKDYSYSKRHRFYVDLSYKYKTHNVSFIYRLRYQNQFKDIGVSDNWQIPDKYLRNKLTVKYSTEGRFTPFIGADTWFNINKRYYDNFRLTLGLSYELNKYSGLDFSYLINHEFNVKSPVTSYIIAVGYNYSF